MSTWIARRTTRWVVALALPFLALVLQLVVWPWVQPFALIFFLPTVFFSALIGGRRAGQVATLLSTPLIYYYFIPPRFAFTLPSINAVVSLGVFIAIGMLFAEVTHRLDTAVAQANAGRRESESQFRAVVEQSLAGLFIAQDGLVVHANQRFAEILGYDSADQIADHLHVDDVITRPGDPRFELHDQPAEGVPGTARALRVRGRGADGSGVELQLQSHPIEFRGAPAVVALVVDVTEQVQAAQLLQDKELLLARTSQAAKIGGWEFDPVTGAEQWTDEVAVIHDLDPAVLPNVGLGLSYYAEESRPIIEQAVTDISRDGTPYDLELEIVTAVGAHKWVRVTGFPVIEDGKVARVQGTMQDITHHRLAETARHESENRYQSLFDSMLEGMAHCEMFFDDTGEPVDWRYLNVNPAFERITELHGAAGQLVSKLIPGIRETNPELFENYGSVARTGEPVEFEAFVPLLPRGQWLHIGVTRPGPNEFIALFNDITDRKEKEAQIQEFNVTLEHTVAQRTAEVTAANKELESFAYAVSHDLRAPLRAMSGFSQALVEDYEDQLDDQAKEYLEHIRAGSRKMAELIDGLLELSRATRGEFVRQEIDVSALSASILEDAHERDPERLVSCVVQPGIRIHADPRMADVLLRNLLDNAWKYTSKTPDARIEVCGRTGDDGAVWVCVRDNGAGFDPEFSAKLFQPFSRLHTQTEFAGVGIGLATVKRVIDRHGGQMTATGEVGKGAEFCFALPL